MKSFVAMVSELSSLLSPNSIDGCYAVEYFHIVVLLLLSTLILAKASKSRALKSLNVLIGRLLLQP